MKKFLKFIIKLILALIIPALIIFSFYKYPEWYESSSNKFIRVIVGVYNIYLGDKALEKSTEKSENKSKQISNAIKYYKKGLDRYPEHYQARCNLANIYVLMEDYSSAMQEYKTALKYKPDYLECRMNLGLLEAEELSRYDEAISEYKQITAYKKSGKYIPYIFDSKDSIKENKINAYYNTGRAYRGKTLFTTRDRLKNNQYLKEAVLAYNKAVEVYNKNYKHSKDKNNYNVLYNLALTHHHLGNVKEAGLNYCKAIESAPLNFEAHLNLGILLDSIGKHPEAIEEYTKAGLVVGDADYETIIYLNDLLNDSYKKNAIIKAMQRSVYTEDEEDNKSDKKDTKEEKKSISEQASIFVKGGKVHIVQESESAFVKRMKVCNSKKIFKDEM